MIQPRRVENPDQKSNEEQINVRLQSKPRRVDPLKPRRYQEELFKCMLGENVIVYLGTGLGKTFITVLYLQSPEISAKIHGGLRVVFLAPTQDLAKQQAEYINSHVPHCIKVYCGRTSSCGLHIDHWNKSHWRTELEQIHILFMTPQIFNAALATGLLGWQEFAAIILDEVHHAGSSKANKESKHPYRQILNKYKNFFEAREFAVRPRLIGLTASPVTFMPKNRQSILNSVKDLEKCLNARCVTDSKLQMSRPELIIHSFSAIDESPDDLSRSMERIVQCLDYVLDKKKKTKLKARLTQNDPNLNEEEKKILSYHNRLKLSAIGFSIKPGGFSKILEAMVLIRKRCGLPALRMMIARVEKALKFHANMTCLDIDLRMIYMKYCEIYRTIDNCLKDFLTKHPEPTSYMVSKPKALLDILKYEYQRMQDATSEKSSFSCIVFVRSRLEVVALAEWMQSVSDLMSEYNFIKCDFALGIAATMSSKFSSITTRKAVEQQRMLKAFRENKLNVVITTAVLEEGIDLPVCSTVIRYDPPYNFREYVQSRGRARQLVSNYIVMCENGKNAEAKDQLDKFNDFELTLRECLDGKEISLDKKSTVITRSAHGEADLEHQQLSKQEVFCAKDGSIMIDSVTGRTILHMYCARLARGSSFLEGIRFSRDGTSGNYRTTLYLPSASPITDKGITIVGNPKSDAELADDAAVIAAIRILYEHKELDENGIPTSATQATIDEILNRIGMATKYEQLTSDLNGEVEQRDGREILHFDTMIFKTAKRGFINNSFSHRYQLVSLNFLPDPEASRAETRQYFVNNHMAIGMIIDASIDPSDIIPAKLIGHYANFKVEHRVLSAQHSINYRDQRLLMDFTHHFLVRYLPSLRVRHDDYKHNCQFHIVPLREQRIDYNYMVDCLSSRDSRCDIKDGDVIRLKPSSRVVSMRNNKSREELYVVCKVHFGLDLNMQVPGMRQTFRDQALRNYGQNVTLWPRQAVFETMRLARQPSITQGKLKDVKADHESQRLFYLEQFVEPVGMAAFAFQALNLPAIIYRLYATSTYASLVEQFDRDTRSMRPIESSKPLEESRVTESFEDLHLNAAGDDIHSKLDAIEKSQAENKEEAQEDGRDNDDDTDDDDDDDYEDEEESSHDDVMSVFSDSSEEDSEGYRRIIQHEQFSFNDRDNKDNLKRWDMSEYKVDNMAQLDCEYRSSSMSYEDILKNRQLESEPLFLELSRRLDELCLDLMKMLANYKLRLINDSPFDADEQLTKREAKVDSSIKAPIQFTGRTQPFRQKGRLSVWREALTLRCAHADVNLEHLESIGDSYIKYITSVILFQATDVQEGILTSARSRLICNKHFTYLAKRRGLGPYLTTSYLERDLDAISLLLGNRYMTAKVSKNNLRQKDLADAFEAIVGAQLVYHNEYEAIMALHWLGLRVVRESMFDELSAKSVVFATPMRPADLKDEQKTLFEQRFVRLTGVEKIIGYAFQTPAYLVQAFTHTSDIQRCTPSYERLELLGDAILDYLVTMTLVNSREDQMQPGQLTASRSALVNNYTFAKLAIKYKFDLYLMHFNEEILHELDRLRSAMEEDPQMEFLTLSDFDRIVKLLADVFESLAGAIYLDSRCNLDAVWAIYYSMMHETIQQELISPSKNPLAELYELYPGPNRITFEHSMLQMTQDGESSRVVCHIKCVGSYEGVGLIKRQAKMRAVKAALAKRLDEESRARVNSAYIRSVESQKPRFNSNRPRGAPRGRGRGAGSGGGQNRGQYRPHTNSRRDNFGSTQHKRGGSLRLRDISK